jgi:vitamin B12 transporter
LGVDAALTDRLSGTLTVNRIAERYDGFVATRAPDYTLVNLSVNYAISAKAEAYLRIENLLDEQYQSVSNYNSSGRAAYFGVRTSF